MFEFSLHNMAGFLAAFIPGLISIVLVIYILATFPRNKLINVFAAFTLSAAFWQFNDAGARITVSAEQADKWDCILSPGWIFTGPLCLHFSLLYTRFTYVSRWIIALLYLPAFAFMGMYQAHMYEHKFWLLHFWGWVNYHDKAPADMVMVYWIVSLSLLASILLFYYAYKVREDKLLRTQAFIIAIGLGIPVVAGVITQAIFPLVLNRPAVPITSSFLTFLSAASAIALQQYRLFSISELVNNDLLLDELPVTVISISDTGHLTYINQAGVDLLKFEKKNIHRLKFQELLNHSIPEHAASFTDAYKKALKGINVVNVESSLAINGKTINILISAMPVVNNKRVRSVLLYVRDITSQIESENVLQQKNLQLEQSNSNLEEFAYVASHDLREPLRKIITFSGMIAETEKDNLSPKAKTFFERIVGAASRMQSMIEDLLSLSVISQNVKFERYSLQEVLHEATQDLDLKIKDKNARIDAEDLPAAYINPKQFRQLFLNLINNSLKFSKPDVPPVITIRSKYLTATEAAKLPLPRTGRYLKITLEDNGIGFENVYAEKMFQLFQRLHGKVDYEGTGIGLAICKKIVENHKGIIWANGEPGVGATFNIVIPNK
ncbi:sensor histidine kinase [Polluticoccus soli]|uniref:sensor histidine kinase n=1 Tax=Polluticoccus soli TaxID=3034150 RepID=UPI0023E30640|nr:ATP-binding protein [Flavipsychrobacter sp. JY13-12]